MSAGINRVVLVGRMTADVNLRKTQSGKSVASFTVAVDRFGSRGQDGGADFINCVVWDAAADNMARYTHKGSLVGVDGRIQTRKYVDRQGNNRTATEVVASSVQFLDPKGSNAGGSYRPAEPDELPDSSETVEPGESSAEAIDVSSDNDLPF